MTISHDRDLQGLRKAGRIVAEVLGVLETAVEPGITTRELDFLCAAELAARGAESAPAKVYAFPGSICISVNEEAVHGIPGSRTIAAGDLVKLDLVAIADGYFADAARSVVVPPAREETRRLARCARSAWTAAAGAARAGTTLQELGRTIEGAVRRGGFRVIPELCGHGVGRSIHEEPAIPNFPHPAAAGRLHEGLVIAIEPIVSAGGDEIVEEDDGWTIRTRDRSWVSHYENTVVVTRGKPIVLTTL